MHACLGRTLPWTGTAGKDPAVPLALNPLDAAQPLTAFGTAGVFLLNPLAAEPAVGSAK